MSSAQKGLLALVGLLVLLVFAGLLCGPRDRAEEGSSSKGSAQVASETRRTQQANLSGTKQNSRGQSSGSLYSLQVHVTAPDGNAVVGARATLLPTAGEDRGPVALASVGNDGRAKLQEIPAGTFQLIVTAGGFSTSLPTQVRLPDEDGREVAVRLLRAARIEGSLYMLDGQAADYGLVRLRSTSGDDTVFHLEPDERGSFRSGALPAGSWEVTWLSSKEALGDPRMSLTRSVDPGELIRLDVTVPGDVSDPAPGRRVGIVEAKR